MALQRVASAENIKNNQKYFNPSRLHILNIQNKANRDLKLVSFSLSAASCDKRVIFLLSQSADSFGFGSSHYWTGCARYQTRGCQTSPFPNRWNVWWYRHMKKLQPSAQDVTMIHLMVAGHLLTLISQGNTNTRGFTLFKCLRCKSGDQNNTAASELS